MRFRVLRSSPALLLSGVVLCALPAAAEPAAADRVMAAALFRDGKALMDRGDLAEACTKIAESQRLDPGGGTLLNLALCHEKQQRLATAWAEYIEALGLAKRDGRAARVQFAQEHIEALEPLLPKLTLVVGAQTDEPELEVSCDGTAVGRAAWGTAIPLDPGEHVLRAVAPGKTPWESTVTVGGAGGRDTVAKIPPLVPLSPARAASPAPKPIAPDVTAERGAAPLSVAAPDSRQVELSHDGQGGSSRTWGFITLGTGVTALGLGTVLAVSALSKKHDSEASCPKDPCNIEAVELSRDAGRLADYATVGFAAGFVLSGLGTYLVLSSANATGATGAPAAAAARAETILKVSSTPHSSGALLELSRRF